MMHSQCRICEEPLLAPFLSLGVQPLANNLLDRPDAPAHFYPLGLTKCSRCHLVQLTEVVPPDELFRHYLYVPSTSATFRRHFEQMAASLVERFDLKPRTGRKPTVVDIGSNDGLLLSFFQKYGLRALGVEPALNLAAAANAAKILTFPDYMHSGLAERLVLDWGPALLITATNVVAHVDDVISLFQAIATVLHKKGVFVLEVPYLPTMLQMGTLDLIYHEHLSYWSLRTLRAALAKARLSIFDVEQVPTHGGSTRVFIEHDVPGKRALGETAELMLRGENHLALQTPYLDFADRVAAKRHDFVRTIQQLKGMTAAYTAPAKATVLLNYCSLTAAEIAFVVDDNPLKQGKYIPGTNGIPVVPYSYLQEHPVDNVVIWAWNLAEEILPKLKGYARQAIIPFPELKVLPV